MLKLSIVDRFLIEIDHGLRSIFTLPLSSRRSPACDIDEAPLSLQEQKDVAALMRINHTGEVCAQGLYRGQMQFAQNQKTYTMLAQSCAEETDHLAWTYERLAELNDRPSYLNPFWYGASFMIGAFTARISDGYSLGFVEETERQVGEHLGRHLERIPLADLKTRAIINTMEADEARHGAHAHAAGADTLPAWFKSMMRLQSKVMTSLAYWL